MSGIKIWVMPIILIARSQKVERQEKLAWIVACLFISWFCLLLFMLIAPLKPNKNSNLVLFAC
ncbi:hypothetical protein CWB60_07205 [Pseudoalteromonas sp. S327]|nr:hypothetical protein CWB60_07205 [Pseudoalteromonas sp. S327]TMO17197.1 hypothetical protein CWB59_11530 [Pseudoalteromonas sp. S326]